VKSAHSQVTAFFLTRHCLAHQ